MRKNLLFMVMLSFVFTILSAQNYYKNSQDLAALVNTYWEEYLKSNPVSATFLGDNRYNDLLYIDFTDERRQEARAFDRKYLTALSKFNRSKLNAQDKIDYDVLKFELESELDGLSHNTNLMPFSQIDAVPNAMVLLGNGKGAQPFKTVKDYENWIKRASVFPAWADSAIVYFNRGVQQKMILPKALVVKMIPQLNAHVISDVQKSVFYGPVNMFPADISEADKKRLTDAYTSLISQQLVPAYRRLRDYLQNEYLPEARTTSGYSALPNGDEMYATAIRVFTTTHMSADQVFNLGLREVARIRSEMEKVKTQLGFTGDMKSFFSYVSTSDKFYPYKTAEEILNYYRNILPKIQPKLSTMFNHVPKTTFEVRQVEAFRAATASASYSIGSLENNRPGIFYVPIVDATRTQVRESLFLHEAIPGHHYQISLQRENQQLSKFRQSSNNAAYAEGWGLYAESLGGELGMYTDPVQHMQALGDEMHRAVRLVVDAGLHAKGWTREQAIQYSLENEPIEEQRATSEVERYMAKPGQALTYKIGELKIKEMRKRYTKQLGKDFNLAAFHDAILMDGGLPLEVLERKMDAWSKSGKK